MSEGTLSSKIDLPAPVRAVMSLRIPSARRVLGNLGLIVSIAVLGTALVFVFFPSAVATHDPLLGITEDSLQGPSAAHWFGTDQMGRDLFSRVVHGAAASLSGTTIAISIALVAGTLIGLISGTVGGVLDDVVMRCVDVLLAIPGLLLAMAVVTAIGFGTIPVAIAVGISAIASFIRLMRAEVYRVAHSRYIEAARLSGASRLSVVFRHIAPNSIGSVIALAALEFGTALLAISALSFLGYGTQPPQPEWGSLVSTGRDFIATAWWLTVLPGVTIAAVVVATNRISRAFDLDSRVQS